MEPWAPPRSGAFILYTPLPNVSAGYEKGASTRKTTRHREPELSLACYRAWAARAPDSPSEWPWAKQFDALHDGPTRRCDMRCPAGNDALRNRVSC